MQIIVNRADLLTALKRLGAAVAPSDLLSVRRCVLIVAEAPAPGEPTRLTLGATSGPLSIIFSAPGEIKEPGRALLNHHGLIDRVNNLPDGAISLTVDDKQRAVVKSSASKRRMTMTGLVPEDFPSVLTGRATDEPLFSIEAKILQQAGAEVSFAIEKEHADGALLSPGEDKQFTLVSMGGHALAIATAWFTERSGSADLVLPRLLFDALDGVPGSDVLTFSEDAQKIYVSMPGSLVIAAKLHRDVPDVWRDVMKSAPSNKRFRISSEAFLESVKAVSVSTDFVEGTERFVQIDVTGHEGVVTISTRQSDRSRGEDELPVIDPDPTSYAFHVDAHYLSAALRSFAPAEVDVFYDVIKGQNMLMFRNETLLTMISLITDVQSRQPPPAKKD